MNQIYDLHTLNINILSCHDLADMTVSRSAIYQLFTQLHQPEYQEHDRIVFYTDQEIPEQLWKHLYQAAKKIDISNYFILICSSKDLKIQSQMQANIWATDCVPFQTLMIPVADSRPLSKCYVIPDTICPLPWTHLEIRNNGTISPCCIYKGSIGNIVTDQLSDVFNLSRLTDIREQFLSGDRPSGCATCWQNENNGVVSNRQRHLEFLSQDFFSNYIDSPKLTSLDLKTGNTCNFKCRICGPESSSLWAQEQKIQSIPLKSATNHNWSDSTDHAFNQIFNHVDTLTNYDLYGGEPFLVKSLTMLVEKIVAAGRASQVRLHYNSNGSIWPEKLILHWQHFQHVDVHFSIDNVGERFELERGGIWHQVHHNILQLKEKNLPNLKISIMPVINIMNVLYLDSVFDWAESLNLDINPLYLQHPPELSIENLTYRAKQEVLSRYQHSHRAELQKVVKIVQNSAGSDGKKFVEYNQHLDKIRKQSFLNTHQDIAEAMGYPVQ